MTRGRIVFLKLLMLAAVAAGLQFALYAARGGARKVVPKDVRHFEELLATGPDVAFMGDSVVRTVSQHDADARSIPEMLQALLPGKTVAALDHAAFHPEVYLALARLIARQEKKPRWAVVPVNVRSFSAGWSRRPEYQFVKERLFMAHDSVLLRVFFKPLCVFQAVDTAPVSQAEYEAAPVMDGTRAVGRVGDFTGEAFASYDDEKMAKKLVFNYMYELSPEHPYIGALKETASVLKSAGVEPVFYLTPVDVETGEKFLGMRFRAAVRGNADVAVSALAEAGAAPLDMLFDLDAGAFAWRQDVYPNEHLDARGRAHVAQRIAERVKL